MRLLIDLQCCQGKSGYRGIGRYALNLAVAIVEEADSFGVEVHLLVNTLFAETLDPIYKRFPDLYADGRIHAMSILESRSEELNKRVWRRQINRLLKDLCIAGLKPDVVLEASPFEGFADSCAMITREIHSSPIVAIAYDFIPYLRPDEYLKDKEYRDFYLECIDSLKKSDGVVCISKSAMAETLEVLNLDPSKMALSYGAADAQFRPLNLSHAEKLLFKSRFGLNSPLISYCGALDQRKNLDNLVEAIKILPENLSKQCTLAVVGKAEQSEIKQLSYKWKNAGLPKNNLKILGYLHDTDLVPLYNVSDAFVFPSFHEGFGLPPLEAIKCGAPVLVSNTTSLPEVVSGDLATFDPASPASISEKLFRTLTDEMFAKRIVEENKRHAQKFSWTNSAREALGLITRVSKTSTARLSNKPDASMKSLLDDIEAKYFSKLSSLNSNSYAPTEIELAYLARKIMLNRRLVERAHRKIELPEKLDWRLEGPFDSNYSLALVNREFALALKKQGHTVELFSSEGTGDFKPNGAFLEKHSKVKELHAQARGEKSDVTSRLMFPPRVDDLEGGLKLLHNFGWEESGFPHNWVNEFNMHLDGITVISEHVSKVLRDNGVEVPIYNVGNGVDHFLEDFEIAAPKPCDSGVFEILHVSSCFPRKGVDVLLRAFASAFTDSDKVRLCIKTFRNPHNTIEADIIELRNEYPNLAPIELIFDDYDLPELRSLFLKSDVVVLPSRAEGFCLPIAEAILAGTPVITTGWSGQMDFASSPMVSLIDFSFKTASTHLPVFDSYWAEPDTEHLTKLLLEARSSGSLDKEMVRQAQTQLLDNFNWAKTAERSVAAARHIAASPRFAMPRVGIVSTFNTKCGIAEYTSHLCDGMEADVTIFAPIEDNLILSDTDRVVRCWRQKDASSMDKLFDKILESKVGILVFQFNYGFFNFESLGSLILRLKKTGVIVVVHFHSTDDRPHGPENRIEAIRGPLKKADGLIVHTVNDLNNLRSFDLVDNVSLIPLSLSRFPTKPMPPVLAGEFVLATYGFFLPQKGFTEIIEAVRELICRGNKVKLLMVNAEYPNPVSSDAISDAKALVKRLDIEECVEFHTNFLSDVESINLLQRAHATVFPYRPTQESASAAVRHGLAANRPVVVTPIGIFEDLGDAVIRLPGISPTEMANGLCDFLQEFDTLHKVQDASNRWRAAHFHDVVGVRYRAFLSGLVQKNNSFSG